MATGEPLIHLEPGQLVPFGGDRVARVSSELAAAFAPGDHLIVVQETGDLLHLPGAVQEAVRAAVSEARAAFAALADVSDEAISAFYEAFAAHLADEDTFAPIAEANAADVAAARARGRSTTRLVLGPTMRADMVAGLRMWAGRAGGRDELVEVVQHEGWRVEARRAPLGVVGFVFEGRPNVFADATGVLRSGNTVVFRIGRDALGTARAIVRHALDPALASSELPAGAVRLLDSPEHAAGWALFSDARLGLAVARGSGHAVAQLGAVARQAGVPVSLHGTGGAWMVAGEHADAERFEQVVRHSLDRKVCNTLNVCCIVRSRADDLVPRFRAALDAAAEGRGTTGVLHVLAGSERWIDGTDHDVVEPSALATEWEWEDRPEVTLAVVDDLGQAIELCNRWSPRFIASLVSDDAEEHGRFWSGVDAPFVGDGFTRWVDGQFALDRPELGLSSWQHGRLLARSGVLSGDSAHTVRLRVHQADPDLHR